MSRDYRPNRARQKKSGGSFLTGFLLGLFLGLALAVGIAWYINKLPSPFSSTGRPAEVSSLPGLVPGTKNKAAPDGKTKATPQVAEKPKPRFDFYKILPGTEEPVSDQDLKQPANATYFLQAGAFQDAADADNLKARLALISAEATIQVIILPDKGAWHRVRLGPYTNVADLNRVRKMLKENGTETTLVKVHEGAN